MSDNSFDLPQDDSLQARAESISETENQLELPKENVSDDSPDSTCEQTTEIAADNGCDVLEDEGSKTLEEALEKYGIKLPSKKVRLLKEYCELLWTWNERLNLTRHTTFDKFVSRDLVDSLHLANLLQKGEHVLDVGSGGGVPGLVIAILRPDVVVELCDSTGKKAEALGSIVDELGLDLNIWYAKAEDLLRTRRFHTLTIRAVGKMRSLLLMFAPVWHTFNRLLLIKGPNWIAERGEARHYNMFNSLALRKVDEYENPGAEHGSVILQICRKTRMEEMERRAKERAEGKPYDGEIEEIVVDNKPRDLSDSKENQRALRRGKSGTKKGGKQEPRPSVKVQDKRSPSSPEEIDSSCGKSKKTEERVDVYARRGGKAPKGWTGKKSDFRNDVKTSEKIDQNRSRNDNRPRSSGRGSSRTNKNKPRDDSSRK